MNEKKQMKQNEKKSFAEKFVPKKILNKTEKLRLSSCDHVLITKCSRQSRSVCLFLFSFFFSGCEKSQEILYHLTSSASLEPFYTRERNKLQYVYAVDGAECHVSLLSTKCKANFDCHQPTRTIKMWKSDNNRQ